MRFIAKRLAIGVLVVLFVTILVFAIMQMMPGDTIDLMVDTRVSAEKVAEIKDFNRNIYIEIDGGVNIKNAKIKVPIILKNKKYVSIKGD